MNNLAFVQCAGSRDRNHLPYCSSICCLASLKQATYLRDYNPDAQAHIFYIDLRAYGRFEYFYDRVRNDEKILLTKGKIVSITEDPVTKDVILEGEDILSGNKIRRTFDMAVLATGMQPNTSLEKVPGPASNTTNSVLSYQTQAYTQQAYRNDRWTWEPVCRMLPELLSKRFRTRWGGKNPWTSKSEFTLTQVTGSAKRSI